MRVAVSGPPGFPSGISGAVHNRSGPDVSFPCLGLAKNMYPGSSFTADS